MISRRYEKKSVILATNLAFRDWPTIFPNATCATALIDRVVHHADVIPIQGESYRYYQQCIAQRTKRSVSLSPQLAAAIEQAADEAGTTFSGWLATAAAHRLRIEAGRRAIAAWEREQGPLTPVELAEGLARARALPGRKSERKRRSA